MKSLIQFIESQKVKGKIINTEEMRIIISKKLNSFKKVKNSTSSLETARMCNFFIEELEDLYNKTYQYDIMESTLEDIKNKDFCEIMN